MNTWIKKSIELANAPGYMDSIIEVYPANPGERRPIDVEVKEELEKLYDERKDVDLLFGLMQLPKFPIEHPYVGFFKMEKKANRKSLLENNPKTVKQIIDMLRSQTNGPITGFDAMIMGSEVPIELNRQEGPMFTRYVRQLAQKNNYSILSEDEFKKSTAGIIILDASDDANAEFAKNNLDYQINKGLDLVAKVDKKYVIGEAKWIGQSGGNQDKSVVDANLLLDNYTSSKAIPINILDGYVWLETKKDTKAPKVIRAKEEVILSALLIGDFLESLR
ncbi:hypothetical protein HX827_05215 [Marine Group I thaumarchaeote]|uniref:Restriction endonuclease n=1 Tax=Marine Group I thaumarchaeote TaxID=2511932 RepID=A0A7K4NV04_9ARCH|nr:hypothetical protein [Marine Group I thaumarchaeote]